ncbi:MAG: PAS domain S-box protein [Methanoregula sp.]|nr:PAS domain S-box protein [Methanoregula sp.]
MTERTWSAVVLILSCAVLFITVWCLSQGITIIFMHLYYIPIILLAYHYRKTGLYLSILLSLLYFVLVAAYGPADPLIIEGAGLRSVVFIGVAALVAFLSEQLVLAQEALRRTANIQQGIIQNANVWLMVLDSAGRILEWNTAAEEISGFDADEVTGKNEVWKLLYPDRNYRKEITGKIKEIIQAENYLENLKTVITCKDGTKKTIVWNTRVLPRDGSGIPQYIAIGVDFTATVTAENELQNANRRLTANEEILKNSEARMRAMLESIIAGVVIIDPDTHTIVDVNAVAARMIGAEKEAIIGSVCHKYICPAEVGACPITDLRRVVDHSEKLLIHADGTTSPILKSVVPITLNDRTYLLESFIDISDIKKAEMALRKSEEQFRILTEQSSDIICTIGLNESITFVSPVIKKILGYDPVEVIGKNAFDFIFRKDRQKGFEAFKSQVIEKGQVQVVTVELVSKDGSRVPVEFTLAPVMKAGVLAEVLVSGRDITERKKAEAAVKKSEDRFRELFNSMTSGVAVYRAVDEGADFVFVDFNHGAEIIEKIPKQEVIGKRVSEVFPGAAGFGIIDVFRRVWQTGESEHYPVSLYADERITGWRENFVYRLPSGEVVAIFDDVTEHRIAEDALRQSEERYRTLFISSRDAIMTIEPPDWRFTSANPATVAMFLAKDEADLTSRGPWEFSPERQPDGQLSAEKAKEMIEKAVKEGSNFFEWTHKRLNGEDFPATVLATRFEWEGEIIVQGTVRDITGQKRAEKALKESEEKFRGVAERSSDIIMLADMDGRATYVSPSVTRILGYDPGEIVGKPPSVFLHPDDIGFVQEQFRNEISGNPGTGIEARVRIKGGGYATLYFTINPIVKEGRLSGIQLIGRDITETKAAQARIDELLRLQEEQVEIINTSPAVAFLWKAEENWPVETVSENISRFGYTPDDFISGRVPFSSIIHPDDLERVAAEVEHNSTNNVDTFYQSYRIFGKDKKEYWIEDFTKIRRDSSETITHFQGIVLDITERKQAELERDRLVSVIRHSGELVGLSTPERKILFLNEAGAKMLGMTSAESLGHDFSEFIPDNQKENLYSVLLPALIEHGRWEGDLQYRNVKTGNLIDVHAMTFLIGDPVTGAPQFLATVSLDITERKKAEAELKKYSEKLEDMVAERTKDLEEAQEQLVKKEKLAVLGKLAGGVGHELRNPLGAIKNAAYFLNMVLENPEPDVKETLEIMNKEVARSEDILSSLLDFARPTVLTLRKVRLNDILSEAASRNPIPENITLARNPDETLPDIMGDPDKLLQVFTNLVTNACQAMPEGGTLTVQSALSGKGTVSVSVTDTGVGISEEHMKRIFEPLFSTKAKGIGLGLVVTKAIVEAHHGSIDLRSEEGKGTTFTVTLPVGIDGGSMT